MKPFLPCLALSLLLALGSLSPSALSASEFHIGAATVESTPSRPVFLAGQMYVRVSERVDTPLFVTALALESREGDEALDQAIIVACDIVAIRPGIIGEVREKLKDKLPGFDLNKLFLNATHTHTAPVTRLNPLTPPKGVKEEDIMAPKEYREFFTDRIAEAVVKAWEARRPGKVGWGQGQAVVGHNRRTVFADGSAAMYGKTNDPNFRSIEGREDHDLDVLFFWDKTDKLIATVINIPCPAQIEGGQNAIDADFWDPVRKQLRERFGEDFEVIPWVGAAGDFTPRIRIDNDAYRRMLRLRGLTPMEEAARRIIQGWDEAYEAAKLEPFEGPVFKHQVATIELPRRRPTPQEVEDAIKEAERLKDNPNPRLYTRQVYVVDLDKQFKKGAVADRPMELHTLRLGDIAISSIEYELFSDFGVQMKARSPAVQTFLIQLTGAGGYLPSQRAVEGGGYSATIHSTPVGPEGGQVIVDRTVESWKKMWEKE